MANCLIITSYLENSSKFKINKNDYDYIICADGGYEIALKLDLTPNLIIGDFDSGNPPKNSNIFIITLPKEKDLTDTEACIKKAIDLDFNDITILGGIGGRLDHTLGNISLLKKYYSPNISMTILNYQNYVFLLKNKAVTIKKNNYKYLSIISQSDISEGIYLKGFKYPLNNYTLTNETTLGISNEIISEKALIKVTNGALLVVLSNDIDKV